MPDEVIPPVEPVEEPSLEAAFGELEASTTIVEEPSPAEPSPTDPPPEEDPPEEAFSGSQPATPAKPEEPTKPAVPAEPAKPAYDINKAPAGFRKYFQSEIEAAKTRAFKLEQELQAERANKGSDSKSLTEALTAREKRIQELESELSASTFRTSQDYDNNYVAPFNAAWRDALGEIGYLQVVAQRDSEGNPINARQATGEDLTSVFNIKNPVARNKAIVEMFGEEGAPVVRSHLDNLFGIARRANAAEQAERQQWQSKQAERSTESQRMAQHRDALWVKLNKDVADRRPEYYQEKPGDTQANDLLKKGMSLVDTYFSNRDKMTVENRILMEANIRHRAGAFDRVVYELNRANAELARLKGEGSERKSQLPGGLPTRQGKAESGPDDAATEAILEAAFDGVPVLP